MKKWKRVVDNKMRSHGDIDYEKKKIRINKKKATTHPTYKRPVNKGAYKYPEILDTIIHEELHRKHPKMTEKNIRKKTKSIVKKIKNKEKSKYYSLYNGKANQRRNRS